MHIYQTVPLLMPAENPITTWVEDMEDIAPVMPVELSAMVQSGAESQGRAKFKVTEVSKVPVTVMVPLLSFPATVEVPPVTVGAGPWVYLCP